MKRYPSHSSVGPASRRSWDRRDRRDAGPTSRRRAVASLELVLVFPLLLILASMLIVVARAGIAKLGTVAQTRQQTWHNGDQKKTANPLSPVQDLQGSQANSAPQVPVALGPGFNGQPPQQATSKNAVIGDTWGYSSVPFASLQPNCQPHTDVLDLFIDDVVPPGVVSAAFTPLSFFNPTNPAVTAGADIMSIGNLAVRIAGEVLDGGGLVGDAFKAADTAAQAALDAAQATPVGGIINGISSLFGGGDGLIDQLKDDIDKITKALDVFDKLNRAAHGQP